jgi:hypothetical protein
VTQPHSPWKAKPYKTMHPKDIPPNLSWGSAATTYPRCYLCRFWEQCDIRAGTGECRRYPPPFTATPAGPITQDRFWCGEFQPQPEIYGKPIIAVAAEGYMRQKAAEEIINQQLKVPPEMRLYPLMDAVRTLLSKGHVSHLGDNQPILDAVSNLRRVAQDIGYEVEENS